MKKGIMYFYIFLIIAGSVTGFISRCNASSFNILKGNKLYKEGYYSDALNKYKLEISKHHGNEKAIFNAGDSFYKLEDYTNAIDYYRKALLNTKDRKIKSMIHYNIGNSFYKLGNYQEALNEYLAALKLEPYNKSIKQNLEITAEKLKNKQSGKNSKKKSQKPGKSSSNEKKTNQSQQKKQNKNENPSANKETQKTNKALTENEAKEILKSLEEKNQYQLQRIIKNRLKKESDNENGW